MPAFWFETKKVSIEVNIIKIAPSCMQITFTNPKGNIGQCQAQTPESPGNG